MVKKLVKSTGEDLPILAEIYSAEFSKPPYNEIWTREKAMSKMKFFKEFNDLYSIFSDEKLVGFIAIDPNFMCPGEVAFGEEMAIESEYQNQGIGTWVFGEIFKMYKERGFKKFLGITDVESRAYQLYKKLGILPSNKDILIEKELNN